MQDIPILHYSHRGSGRALAERTVRGVESTPGFQARLKTVPRISTVCKTTEPTFADNGAPCIEMIDLEECSIAALGSPFLSEPEGRRAYAQGRRLANLAKKSGRP